MHYTKNDEMSSGMNKLCLHANDFIDCNEDEGSAQCDVEE